MQKKPLKNKKTDLSVSLMLLKILEKKKKNIYLKNKLKKRNGKTNPFY